MMSGNSFLKLMLIVNLKLTKQILTYLILQSNTISHWLGENLESALCLIQRETIQWNNVMHISARLELNMISYQLPPNALCPKGANKLNHSLTY